MLRVKLIFVPPNGINEITSVINKEIENLEYTHNKVIDVIPIENGRYLIKYEE